MFYRFLERRYSKGKHYRNAWYNGKSVSSNVGKSVSIISNMQRALPLESRNFFAKLIWEISSTRNLLAQFQREETQLFVLRVMVGLVILYDHVHPQGAFVKGSNVDVSIGNKFLTQSKRFFN